MIRGNIVSLRPATNDDRRNIFTWLVASDVTPYMMGPPTFPDVSIPTWEDFILDYALHFFDGTRPECGRSFIIEFDGNHVGHINYDGLDTDRLIAELDIWMRSQAYCCHGYGTDAMVALMHYLHSDFKIKTFFVRPSRRNQRAIRAYKKIGFRLHSSSAAAQTCIDDGCDYSDTITLEWNIPAS